VSAAAVLLDGVEGVAEPGWCCWLMLTMVGWRRSGRHGRCQLALAIPPLSGGVLVGSAPLMVT
jgi:hypothetical protein